MSDTESTNIELRLLIQQVRDLAVAVRENTEEQRRVNTDHETRLRSLETGLTKYSERLTLWQIFQTTLTTIMTGAAAWAGRQP